MKVLVVHNFYGSAAPSGENQVFDSEISLLRSKGCQVFEFTRHSDEIRNMGGFGMIIASLSTPWNPFMARAIRRQVELYRPDVVHVHNTFPLLSPAIFHAIGLRAARVLTLHNYRLFCPSAIPMRSGSVCTDCLDARTSLPSLKYGCYRSSRIATLPLAVSVGLHRFLGTWRRKVDAYIALSDFQKQLMVYSGLPEHKVAVKPNFYPGLPSIIPWHERAPYVVFAGRLTAEKGVLNLLRAWQAWGADAPDLHVVGDGELRSKLEKMSKDLPVRFLGQMSGEAAQAKIAGARLLILPSECYEGFPMVIREAFAFGTPAAVSNLGPLPNIVKDGQSGMVFEAANPDSLLNVVRSGWQTPYLLEHLGLGARTEFETKYTEEANYKSLIKIYERAIAMNRGYVKA